MKNTAKVVTPSVEELRTVFGKLGESFEPGDMPSIDCYRLSLLIESALAGSEVEVEFRLVEGDSVNLVVEHEELGEFEVVIKPLKLTRS